MGILRTYLVASLIVAAAPGSARATEGLYGDPVTFFAACAGRLSAQMEFQWLLSDPASDQTQAQRGAVLDILDAITPAAARPDVLNRRVSAKQAQAALLRQARFGSDPASAEAAGALALRHLESCTALLLG